jgi:hypothetical protein
LGWLSAVGVGAVAAALVALPTAAGGGAVRLMHPAAAVAHTRSKESL